MLMQLEGRYNFNPHSPCGERQDAAFEAEGIGISIHTPLAGSDVASMVMPSAAREFQSTLPLRGATRVPGLLPVRWSHFNPHSPCGERQKSASAL